MRSDLLKARCIFLKELESVRNRLEGDLVVKISDEYQPRCSLWLSWGGDASLEKCGFAHSNVSR